MKQLTKAQLTVGLLACFAMAWGLFQPAFMDNNVGLALAVAVLQLGAIIVISFVVIAILEWVDIFDLKTNAILTLIVLVTIRISYVVLTSVILL